MIRPLTCLCLGAAFFSGLYLYAEKHKAEMLDRQIGAVMLKTEEARARSVQLQTEWAMLNEPGRLKDMAGRYITQLKPMTPGQFVQLANLADHLPAPQAPKPEGTTDEDAQIPVAGDPAAASADPAPDAAPVQVADPVVPKPPVAHPTTRMLAKADSKPRHVASADAMPRGGALARGVMLPLATPQPMGARVLSAMAHPAHAPRAAMVSVTPAYAAPAYIGSAIATGRSALPPPVPLGAGEQ